MGKSIGEELRDFRKSINATQEELAAKIGIKRARYANFESGHSRPDELILNQLRKFGFQSEVGPPLIPASQLLVPIPYIGYVAASNPVNWTDPYESESFEYVPPEMGDARGRFACRVASDSMMPFLEPDDILVFQKSEIPKLRHIILYRSEDNLITVKQLGHNGTNYVLIPINPRYDEIEAKGETLGFLVGIIRERGTLRTTIYDASGIRP